MNSDLTPEKREELLDDFYAECDELLTAVREGLIALEKAPPGAPPDRAVLEGLFRNTHSLKGNSSIVGLRASEQIAHEMENTFRALTNGNLGMTASVFEVLLTASQRLEQVITAQRHSHALPVIDDVLEALKRVLSAKSAVGPSDAVRVVAEEGRKSIATLMHEKPGVTFYDVSFTPTKELDQRGVNVKSVRERLAAVGEIISSIPNVRPKGSVTFEFVVGLRKAAADFAAWTADGIHFVLASTSLAEAKAGSLPDETLSLTPSHIVRVDLSRLDELMRITGEMVIQRSRLEDRLAQGGEAFAGLREINLGFSRSLREMREAVTRVRMVPIAEIFTRMPFVVRELARDSIKRARVVLEGNQTEVDKYLAERLKEPLLHLVRNAFAHGIESPAERKVTDKPTEGTITLRAKSVGESIIIQVQDDGQGIDAEAILTKAKLLGLALPANRETASVLEILCLPGFSSRDDADLAAGRGVGMSVVANAVRELGGAVTLETSKGSGTMFTLKVPLTLSIADAIIVGVGAETCAIPQSAVEEIAQASYADVRTIQQTELVPHRGGLLPLVQLRKMFGLEISRPAMITFLVVATDRGTTGLVVDRLRSQREIVIRPLSDPLLRVPGISGVTELGDGRPVLILDPAAITQGVVRPPNVLDQRDLNLSVASPS